jgi:hypothetical protein
MDNACKNEIPYIYLFIYSKLKKKAWRDKCLATHDVLFTIRRDCSPKFMPNNLVYHMLSQMEAYGLIKRIHKLKYHIIDTNIDMQGFDQPQKYIRKDEEDKNKKDDFQKSIESINKIGKIKCEDDCLYKILPSKELKKLNELNCWFVKA